jgi:hypothetical protein
MLNLPLSLDNKETFLATQRRLLLQSHDMLDTGILNAGNDVFFHISTAKIYKNETQRHRDTEFFVFFIIFSVSLYLCVEKI